jgi:hypothetical protein
MKSHKLRDYMNYYEKQLSAFTLQAPDSGYHYKLQIVGASGTRTKHLDLNTESIEALEKFLKREKRRIAMAGVSNQDGYKSVKQRVLSIS